MTELTDIAGTLGVSVAGSVAAAYLLFRYLGDKWIAGKFSERLEGFKHVQQQEIERLRLMINTAFDRTIKLHAHEYEILPEVWEKLNDAFGNVNALVSPFQQYPDLDKLSDPALEHFLSECGLPQYQQDELRQSRNRANDYQNFRYWLSHGRVQGKLADFHRHFRSKGIFIQPDIKDLIGKLDDMMFAALLESEHEKRYPDLRPDRWEKSRALADEGEKLREEIEAAIHGRLWNTAPTSPEAS